MYAYNQYHNHSVRDQYHLSYYLYKTIKGWSQFLFTY